MPTPNLLALEALLNDLDGRKVHVTRIVHAQGAVDQRMIDEIHAGLLRKKRAGDLGLA